MERVRWKEVCRGAQAARLGARASQLLSAALILSSCWLAASVATCSYPLSAQLNTDPKSPWKQGDHQVRRKCSICTELLLTPESLMGTNQCPCCHLGKWVPAGPESLVLALLLPFYISILEESKGVFIRIGLLSVPSPYPFSKPYWQSVKCQVRFKKRQ